MLAGVVHLAALAALWCAPAAAAGCVIRSSVEVGAVGDTPNRDALARLLAEASQCPDNVLQLRALLHSDGFVLQPTMVANRGYHNPSLGSFSIFEVVHGVGRVGGELHHGDFFFGHFTAAAGAFLIADQEPRRDALLIELIAWDNDKGLYNFYELRGDGQRGRWYYRGDSADMAADNALVQRSAPPVFGARLRCSGCHLGGGPIMKELTAPHNDWWRKERPLPLGGRTPDAALANILAGLQDASLLSQSVAAGMAKLHDRGALLAEMMERSLQEVLRPLFCPMELNLESDLLPADSQSTDVQVPAAFFIDARFGGGPLPMPRAAYEYALVQAGAQFPETDRRDADYAWLTPVRAQSDGQWIDNLELRGIIDSEWIADILAVDPFQPIFSARRCALLHLVPASWSTHWRASFQQNLREAAASASVLGAGARELLTNLTRPERTTAFHRGRALGLLQRCAARWQRSGDVMPYVQLLAQRRADVAKDAISMNPLGEIGEPGFRVIFPTLQRIAGAWHLDDNCEVIAD